jgi:hypothetical protein
MSAIPRTIRAAFYRAAFITVRFVIIDLPARSVRLARRRGQHRATSKMHRHHRWGDPLQSLGGPHFALAFDDYTKEKVGPNLTPPNLCAKMDPVARGWRLCGERAHPLCALGTRAREYITRSTENGSQ